MASIKTPENSTLLANFIQEAYKFPSDPFETRLSMLAECICATQLKDYEDVLATQGASDGDILNLRRAAGALNISEATIREWSKSIKATFLSENAECIAGKSDDIIDSSIAERMFAEFASARVDRLKTDATIQSLSKKLDSISNIVQSIQSSINVINTKRRRIGDSPDSCDLNEVSQVVESSVLNPGHNLGINHAGPSILNSNINNAMLYVYKSSLTIENVLIDWHQLKLSSRFAWVNSSQNYRGFERVFFVMSHFNDILTMSDKQMLASTPPDPNNSLRSTFTNNLKSTATNAVMRFKASLEGKVSLIV